MSDLVFEIGGCSKERLDEDYKSKLNVEQVKEVIRPNQFISIPAYDIKIRKKLINFFTLVIKACIYEEFGESEWNS